MIHVVVARKIRLFLLNFDMIVVFTTQTNKQVNQPKGFFW